MIVSNRNNTSFDLPNPSPKNSTAIPSDSLSTFALNHDGTLEFTQLWPAGGAFPRHFSINKSGDLVAVALQNSEEVIIMSRDVTSGNLGKPVAKVDIPGNVTCVMWHE